MGKLFRTGNIRQKWIFSSSIYGRNRISKSHAENRSCLLDTYEAMAVNFAHEIEHTTSDNIRLMHEKSSKSVIEKSPIKISRDMIRELYMTKPLDSLDALYKASK